jgi:hypothetical protein
VRHRGLLLVLPAAVVALLAAPGALAAAPGAALTVPAQVQASTGANPILNIAFSYPEVTPFCTVGVDFTWDGATWLSEFPSKNGALCVAAGNNATAPTGHVAAGAHQVCGSAGPQFHECKAVTVVVTAGSAKPAPGGAPATNPGGVAAVPVSGQAATPIPTQAPAGPVPAAITRLPRETATGAVLLAVGLAGLLVVGGRRLLLRGRRRRTPPLPSPSQRR